MQENKQDKYEFISEKIKDKPVNKKKLAYHVCIVVFLAVLFGIVASVTFVLCQPKIDGMLHPQEDPTITIPKDEPVFSLQSLDQFVKKKIHRYVEINYFFPHICG